MTVVRFRPDEPAPTPTGCLTVIVGLVIFWLAFAAAVLAQF